MRTETIAALEASNQRLRDLVRYKRMELFEDGLIDEKEYSDLLTNTPGAVSRLEGYDKIKSQLAEARDAVAHAYQFAGANEAPVELLDNYSAIASGGSAPHPWSTAEPLPVYGERDVLANLILSGFTYDPGHSDLDDEQPITVRMTLGDYRKVRNMR